MTNDITPFDLSAVQQAMLASLTARQHLLRRSAGWLEPQLAVLTPALVPYASRVPDDAQKMRFADDRLHSADRSYVHERR